MTAYHFASRPRPRLRAAFKPLGVTMIRIAASPFVNIRRVPSLFSVTVVGLALLARPAQVPSQTTTLVSSSASGGTSGNGASFLSAINANGRFVAFESDASDLVPNDNNGTTDIFVRDMQTGRTSLVSVNQAGDGSGNGDSDAFGAVISSSGRFLVFRSNASDLVANDTNGNPDVFVRDLRNGTTTLVSVNLAGSASGNDGSGYDGPSISDNGRFVAFVSAASDLVALDTSNGDNIFVRDLKKNTTSLVTVNQAGTGGGNGGTCVSAISADGRFVVFSSGASDLVPNDTNGKWDVFVRDLALGKTILVSTNRAGSGGGNGDSIVPTNNPISADGRYVVFYSDASDLVANDTNGKRDVFVRDLRKGTTTLVSIDRFAQGSGNGSSPVAIEPQISTNGRLVGFDSDASDLVMKDSNGVADAFAHDLNEGTTVLASGNQAGTSSGNGSSSMGAVSAKGHFIAFVSDASDLVAGDTNGATDVFVHDLRNGLTTLESVNRDGSASGNQPSGAVAGVLFSADEHFIAFNSYASDLVANDDNGVADVFVRAIK